MIIYCCQWIIHCFVCFASAPAWPLGNGPRTPLQPPPLASPCCRAPAADSSGSGRARGSETGVKGVGSGARGLALPNRAVPDGAKGRREGSGRAKGSRRSCDGLANKRSREATCRGGGSGDVWASRHAEDLGDGRGAGVGRGAQLRSFRRRKQAPKEREKKKKLYVLQLLGSEGGLVYHAGGTRSSGWAPREDIAPLLHQRAVQVAD